MFYWAPKVLFEPFCDNAQVCRAEAESSLFNSLDSMVGFEQNSKISQGLTRRCDDAGIIFTANGAISRVRLAAHEKLWRLACGSFRPLCRKHWMGTGLSEANPDARHWRALRWYLTRIRNLHQPISEPRASQARYDLRPPLGRHGTLTRNARAATDRCRAAACL